MTTGQATSSTTYVNLATVQASTITTGTIVRVSLAWQQSTVPALTDAAVAISGATTLAASAFPKGGLTNNGGRLTASAVLIVTAGSNTFTMQFKTDGTSVTFSNRVLVVERLN